ncbi:MAG: M20/M25/M40 family metallo-hydrolase, partial [Ilumatobacteraceae bacterium]
MSDTLTTHIDHVWDDDIVPALHDYIAIPNVSVLFDPQWREHGHMDRAVELIRAWCAGRAIAGLVVEVHELPGLTPVILMEIPAFGTGSHDDTVLLYGHLDKQPEMTGWRDDLGPWKPVLDGDRLYGRGGADDGYAAFASLLAIEAAQANGMSHTSCVVLIEASEESGSPDLPAYLQALQARIGTPSLVLCLDSGCLDLERLWVTTSLRGLAAGTLRVQILTEGVHSGEASGLVPSTFRICREILDRIEDSFDGRILLSPLHVDIPPDRRRQAAETAAEFPIGGHFPFVAGAEPMVADPVEQLLARTWYPALSVTGVDGMPPVESAGNVLRPYTALQLSLRLPPTCDHEAALEAIESALVTDPPYGAHVTFEDAHSGPGWNAPVFSTWLQAALDEASVSSFGNPSRAFGEGGSIPFMGMLGEMFPE